MSFRTTIILAVIAGILALIFVFLKPAPAVQKQNYLLKESELGDVSEITLAKENSEIVCQKRREKGKDIWYIKKPIQAKAAEHVISDILYSAKWAQIQYIVKKDEIKGLADCGLDKPQFTASFKTPANNFTLHFGKESSLIKGNVFVQLEGDGLVYVISKSALDSFDKDAKAIREKHILEYEPSDIMKIKLSQKYLKGTQPYYEEVECERTGQEGEDWKVIKPADFKIDIGQVNRLVKDVKDLEIKDFLPQGNTAQADFGLEMPETKIEVYEKNQSKPLEFHFGRRMPADQNKIYARDPESKEKEVLVLDYEKFSALPITLDSLKTTTIFDFTIDQIKGLTLLTENENIELGNVEEGKEGKKTSKWVLRKPQVTIKEQYIEPFINNLLGGKIKEFLEKEPADYATYGLDEPKCKLTVALKSDSATSNKTYLFSAFSDEGDGYMKKDWDKQVYTVDRDFYQTLKRGTLNFLDNVMLQIDKTSIRSISCEYTYKTLSGQDITDKYVCVYDENAKKWISQQPANKDIDDSKMNHLLEKLSHIETKLLLSRDAKDIPKFKLNMPDIKVTIKYKADGKDAEKTLLIAILDKTHNDAKLADSEIIFKLATDVTEAIIRSPYKDSPY